MMEKQPRKRCWASLAMGFALGAIALAAMRIDLINNYEFGAKVSAELAGVMALAAIGVTALPAAAALRGWDWLLRLGTIASVILTIWAAISAYADRQGQEILQRQAAQTSYVAAQADMASIRSEIAQSRAELARIGETGTVETLTLMLAEAGDAAKREEARGGCGKACEQRKAEAFALAERLGQARAKQAVLARIAAGQKKLDAIQHQAKAGPAEASMLATVIAAQTGKQAEDIARWIALATTSFAIIVTLLMAGLMHQAVSLFMQGLGTEQKAVTVKVVEPVATEIRQALSAAKSEPPAPAKTAELTAEQRIELFIARHVHIDETSEGIRSVALYTEFCDWWAKQSITAPLPSRRAFYHAMAGKGFLSIKRGGVMQYEKARFAAAGLH